MWCVLAVVRRDHTGWTAERDVTVSTLTAAIQSPASATVLQVGQVSYAVTVWY